MLGATTINIPFTRANVLILKSDSTFIVVLAFDPYLVGHFLISYCWYLHSAIFGYMSKVVTLVTFYF